MFNKIQILKNQKGSIAATFTIILTILTSILLYTASSSLANKIGIERTVNNALAMGIAEGGAEKALWKLKQGSYTGETGSTDIAGGQFDVTVSVSGNERTITVVSYVPSKASPKYKKSVKVKVTDEPAIENVAFNYAIQGGEGGINVFGGPEIQGSLYSNANITFTGSAHEVSGSASAHGTVSPNPNPRVHGPITTGVPIIPLPDINTDYWKEIASQGNVISGSYVPPSGTTTMGPTKITGSFQMSSQNQKINLTGPLYIQGSAHISGGEFILDSSLGSNGTIIIVDGQVDVSGGTKFISNGDGRYILLISTSTHASEAIKYTGNADSESLALFTPVGGLTLQGKGELVALCGKTLNIGGDGEVKYKQGLASAIFSGGPGGTWDVIEWQEIKAP